MNKKYAFTGLLLILLASVGIGSFLTPASTLSDQLVSVHVTIRQGSDILSDQTLDVNKGATALSVFDELHELDTQEFAGLGTLITGVDGLAQDDSHYWIFFINDEPAQEGVSIHILQESTSLSLALLTADESAALFE